MHTLLTVAKAIALVAIFFLNPLIIGSVYVGLLILRTAAKSIRNKHDRMWAFAIVSLFVAFIAPMFFAIYPGWIFCVAFAGLLTWVFYPCDKEPMKTANCDEKPLSGPEKDIIDVEVISVKTIYPE